MTRKFMKCSIFLCVHKGGGRWVGRNKVVELKKKKEEEESLPAPSTKMERKLAQIWGWRGGSCSKFQTQLPVVDYMSVGEMAGFIWASASREIKVLNVRQGANLSLFWDKSITFLGFPGDSAVKKRLQCRRHSRLRFDPWVRKIPWRRERQPTPVFLPGESHGQRSLVGYSL